MCLDITFNRIHPSTFLLVIKFAWLSLKLIWRNCKLWYEKSIFLGQAHFVIVHLHNRSRADAINRKALWSKSSTAPFLSKYALGILEQRIHQSDNYVVRRLSSTTWGVLHKSYSEGNYQEGEYTKFNRVRKVVIEDEGVPTIINCTCGGIQRFMLPCPHSLAMMEDLKMTVNLCNCHYRWHKTSCVFHSWVRAK